MMWLQNRTYKHELSKKAEQRERRRQLVLFRADKDIFLFYVVTYINRNKETVFSKVTVIFGDLCLLWVALVDTFQYFPTFYRLNYCSIDMKNEATNASITKSTIGPSFSITTPLRASKRQIDALLAPLAQTF